MDEVRQEEEKKGEGTQSEKIRLLGQEEKRVLEVGDSQAIVLQRKKRWLYFVTISAKKGTVEREARVLAGLLGGGRTHVTHEQKINKSMGGKS